MSPAPAPVILVSLDGVRADAVDAAVTPVLARLAAGGVRGAGLIPTFPSKTFPSHWSMATGLWPERHGMVSNHFWDPELRATFHFDRPGASDPRWWRGEPIWITAERQGLTAATFFWPGADVPIAGRLPTYGRPFAPGVPHAERVDAALGWLDLPVDRRPSLITLYFADADHAGHDHGPGSPEVRAALARVDRALGRLVGGLEERGLADRVNLVIVSDHGMEASSPDRVILLDDFIDLDDVRIPDWDPVAALWPDPGKLEAVARALTGAHPHLTVWRREDVPARLHYRDNPRIPPLVAVADPGWRIASRRYREAHPERFAGGTHGYDPAAPSMHGLFVAHGPAFGRGVVVPAFDNVRVHALVAHALGIAPAPGAESLGAARAALAPAPAPDAADPAAVR